MKTQRTAILLIPVGVVGILLLTSSASRADPADPSMAAHNPGTNCLVCHPAFKAAGTVYQDAKGAETKPGTSVVFTAPDGRMFAMNADAAGNLSTAVLSDGRFLIQVNAVTSRTWHALPSQGSCNVCHKSGGNGSANRTKTLPAYHTQLPADNDCRSCHHFPASQTLDAVMTPGVLSAAASDPPAPGSRVDILGRVFDFDPAQYTIKTTRPDVFAPGSFSMFDVILAVAKKNGIRLSHRFDLKAMTYFINSIEGKSGSYWYRFSYDAGSGNAQELNNRRANRWDETLWRPGVWIKVVQGDAIEEIKAEYWEEIARERALGHVIPNVRISINPSNYHGNPPGSGRITVSRDFTNVKVGPHDWRGTGTATPYPKPFRPGVVTSMDILLSLQDQGALDLVTGMFYTFFSGHYINSYYVVSMGFPGVGTAHASGRQGFTYTTENGAPNRLPNNAAATLHITSDIHVIHAPDFSQWQWRELGNPYYESREPGFEALLNESVKEDFEAMNRSFNLHRPTMTIGPREGGEIAILDVSVNVFVPGPMRLDVRDSSGRVVAVLFDARVEDLGIRRLRWDASALKPGTYELVMTSGASAQARSFAIPASRR